MLKKLMKKILSTRFGRITALCLILSQIPAKKIMIAIFVTAAGILIWKAIDMPYDEKPVDKD